MTVTPQDRLAIHIERGNSFIHGLPLDADPPSRWCATSYPSLVCTCGSAQLTWGYTPGVVAAGTPLTACVQTLAFVHAANPQTGEGVACVTHRPQTVCTCGTYRVEWEPLEV